MNHDDNGEPENARPSTPVEDQFDPADDPVDFMSDESFPASDPPPPQAEEEQ